MPFVPHSTTVAYIEAANATNAPPFILTTCIIMWAARSLYEALND